MEETARRVGKTTFNFVVDRKRLGCLAFTILLLITLGLLSYLTYEVRTLSDSKTKAEEDSPAAASLVGDNDDLDEGEGLIANMTNIQKILFNIGIMQKDAKNCAGTEAIMPFNNIDYAFFVYDIYRGFPLTDSRDPGFIHHIFKADYSSKHQTADCRFALPNGYVAVSSVSCVTSFSSTIIRNVKELESSLSTMAQAGLGYKGLAFSASTEYRRVSSSLNTQRSVYIVSSAYCDYYFVKMRDQMPPSFDDDFLIWLSKLDSSDLNTTYIEFMDRYGTHFLSEATFGARYTNEYEMDSTDFEDFVENKVRVDKSASFAGKLGIGAGGSLETSERKRVQEFSEKVKTRTITVGASPPSNGKALTWASVIKDNPVPSRFALKPIEDLFVPEFVGSLGIDYETIRFYMMKYKDDYRLYREQSKTDLFIHWNNRLGIWNVTKTLSVKGGTQGSWRKDDFCGERKFAIGYDLKIEPDQGRGDDTGLNAVKLICADRSGYITGNTITSRQSIWGHYKGEKNVPPSWISTNIPYTIFTTNGIGIILLVGNI